MADKAPTKGKLSATGGATLTFHYNPSDITISKSSDWKATATKASKAGAKPEFTGTNPREIKMQLHLEGWAINDSDQVSDAVNLLFTWTNPTDASHDKNKSHPPTLVLQWGPQSNYFPCYLKSVSAKYTMFDGDGNPLRAVVDISLGETPEDAYNQNPTSGGVAGRRQHTVVAGDTLQSIAYKEYGDATMWRALAIQNGIDDPMRVRPGHVLLVPPQTDAIGAR